jgi:hypothetical protein
MALENRATISPIEQHDRRWLGISRLGRDVKKTILWWLWRRTGFIPALWNREGAPSLGSNALSILRDVKRSSSIAQLSHKLATS